MLLLLLIFFFNTPVLAQGLELNQDVKYLQTDTTGRYLVLRNVNFNASENQFTVKKSTYNLGDYKLQNVLSEQIVISNVGYLRIQKSKLSTMRPMQSRYLDYINGEKYYSEIKVYPQKKAVTITKISPLDKWNGTETQPIPKHKGLVCFYSQITDCINLSGYLKLATDRKSGNIRVQIIWDNYPFKSSKLFTMAHFTYEGMNPGNLANFSLSFDKEIIFFQVNERGVLEREDWNSQTFSFKKVDTQSLNPHER